MQIFFEMLCYDDELTWPISDSEIADLTKGVAY